MEEATAMKYRDLMTLTAAISFICGIVFALGPPAFIPHFDFYESKAPLTSMPLPPMDRVLFRPSARSRAGEEREERSERIFAPFVLS
jgi:hypothetical protein